MAVTSADLPGTKLPIRCAEPEAARPAEGRHAQHVRGGARRRVLRLELAEEGGGAHLPRHVEVVVAGRPVRAEGEVHPRRGEAGHRADAARELEVRLRTVQHRGAPVRELPDLVGEEVRHVDRGEPGVDESEPGEAGEGAFPRLADRVLALAGGLVEVDVYREIEPLGDLSDAFERLVAHRVGGVRGERRRHQWIAPERFVHLESAGEVRVPIRRPGGRHVEDDEAEHGPDPRIPRNLPHHVRKEVHVVETGGSTHQHLGHRETCSGPDEPFIHEPGLGRPDVLREPHVQRQIVGQTPEQGHRGVGMSVDESGYERVPVEVDAFAGGEPRVDLIRGAERGDGAGPDGERVTLEDPPGRLDRDDPRSAQHEIRRLPVSHGANSTPPLHAARRRSMLAKQARAPDCGGLVSIA